MTVHPKVVKTYGKATGSPRKAQSPVRHQEPHFVFSSSPMSDSAPIRAASKRKTIALSSDNEVEEEIEEPRTIPDRPEVEIVLPTREKPKSTPTAHPRGSPDPLDSLPDRANQGPVNSAHVTPAPKPRATSSTQHSLDVGSSSSRRVSSRVADAKDRADAETLERRRKRAQAKAEQAKKEAERESGTAVAVTGTESEISRPSATTQRKTPSERNTHQSERAEEVTRGPLVEVTVPQVEELAGPIPPILDAQAKSAQAKKGKQVGKNARDRSKKRKVDVRDDEAQALDSSGGSDYGDASAAKRKGARKKGRQAAGKAKKAKTQAAAKIIEPEVEVLLVETAVQDEGAGPSEVVVEVGDPVQEAEEDEEQVRACR